MTSGEIFLKWVVIASCISAAVICSTLLLIWKGKLSGARGTNVIVLAVLIFIATCFWAFAKEIPTN